MLIFLASPSASNEKEISPGKCRRKRAGRELTFIGNRGAEGRLSGKFLYKNQVTVGLTNCARHTHKRHTPSSFSILVLKIVLGGTAASHPPGVGGGNLALPYGDAY